MELANCAHCGAVFAKGMRDICQKCYHEEEEAFKKVYKFLSNRKNREATIIEIVDGTGVEEELIIKFIKEKRLRASEFPNLTYACEKCGNPIIEGKLCQACKEDLINAIEYHDQITAKEEELKSRQSEQIVYYSVNKHQK